jgi:hypothetical protein
MRMSDRIGRAGDHAAAEDAVAEAVGADRKDANVLATMKGIASGHGSRNSENTETTASRRKISTMILKTSHLSKETSAVTTRMKGMKSAPAVVPRALYYSAQSHRGMRQSASSLIRICKRGRNGGHLRIQAATAAGVGAADVAAVVAVGDGVAHRIVGAAASRRRLVLLATSARSISRG